MIDNTADGIRAVVIAMFEKPAGVTSDSPGDIDRNERFNKLVRTSGLVGFSQIGRAFRLLSQHRSDLVRKRLPRKQTCHDVDTRQSLAVFLKRLLSVRVPAVPSRPG